MQRSLIKKLIEWKEKDTRKPLLINGARQTGKTYLLQSLFGEHFDNVLRIDFLEPPEMAETFSGSLTPKGILSNIELLTNEVFNPTAGLLILDEIALLKRKGKPIPKMAIST